jgi:predicted CXXCH cytochrome family protein
MRNALKVLFVLALAIPTLASAVVEGTKHNLSTSGTGGVKFAYAGTSCAFCHVVHNANTMTALWARADGTGGGYTTTTTTAGTTLPAATSVGTKKCFSCHDGTVALNQVVKKGALVAVLPGNYSGTAGLVSAATNRLLPASVSYFASLEGQHPVGIPYVGSTAGGVVSQAAAAGYQPALTAGCAAGITVCVTGVATEGTKVKLFGTTTTNASIECASCHEPHESTNAKFLRMNSAANYCSACHIK